MTRETRRMRLRSESKRKSIGVEPQLELCCAIETPLSRRRQTIAVAWHLTSITIFTLVSLLFLAFPLLWVFSLPYLIYYFSDKTPANGRVVTRFSPWFRHLGFWTAYCNYFPINIVKTVDLPPTFDINDTSLADQYVWKVPLWPTKRTVIIKKWVAINKMHKQIGPKYIFGYHPHGVGALGAFGAFATEGAGWSKLFPGIYTSLMTLVTQFQIPVYRDYLMALGITSVSKKNALKVLANNQSICIVVGGAMESLLSLANKSDIVLHRRKGFVKLAILSGNTSLVPVFAFGETNVYNILETKDGSFLRKIQLWIKETYGFTIPFFYARSIFNYDFGLLPFRKQITLVMGRPIHVKEQNLDPPQELIDHYHTLYVEELKRIYYDNRDKYGFANIDLNFAG